MFRNIWDSFGFKTKDIGFFLGGERVLFIGNISKNTCFICSKKVKYYLETQDSVRTWAFWNSYLDDVLEHNKYTFSVLSTLYALNFFQKRFCWIIANVLVNRYFTRLHLLSFCYFRVNQEKQKSHKGCCQKCQQQKGWYRLLLLISN